MGVEALLPRKTYRTSNISCFVSDECAGCGVLTYVTLPEPGREKWSDAGRREGTGLRHQEERRQLEIEATLVSEGSVEARVEIGLK